MANRKPEKSVCFYFQVHQPFRLSKLNIFDLDTDRDYFSGTDSLDNSFYVKKVGQKSYYPTNKILQKLLKKYQDFKISFSLSGVALEQFSEFDPGLIDSFGELVDSKRAELLNETYYHSLSWLYSKEEFVQQILLHRRLLWKLFKRKPKIFRNTELIYNNELANFIARLGFDGILAEGWDHYLQGKSPNFVYKPPVFDLSEDDQITVSNHKIKSNTHNQIAVLLKNYKLSDDIAFRFSDKNWKEHPLTVDKFVSWVETAEGQTINLFMDYETYGEHQWEDSGIFEFLEKLPGALLKKGISFKTPSETIVSYPASNEIDMHHLVSWADMERDVSAWLGNRMQQEALAQVYAYELKLHQLKASLHKTQFIKLLDTWRKLQTSDHFYYMSTKYWSDGDIHKYFSPYDSPYDAYINYMNVLNDFDIQVHKLTPTYAN